jgi:TonB family protein
MTILDNPATAEWIVNLAFHSLLLLVIGRAALRLAGRASAPIRSGICLAAMTALVLLPVLTASLNTLPRPLYRTASIEVKYIQTYPVPTAGSVTPPAAAEPHPGKKPFGIKSERMGLTGQQTGSRPEERIPLYIPLINALGLIWLAGSIILLGRLIVGLFSARVLQKSGVPVSDNRLLRLLEEAERILGKNLPVPVLESGRVGGPLAAGFLRPKILVPSGFLERITEDEIRGILLHELSHVYHRDPLKGVLQRIFTALIWWNPLAHEISADFSRARETISDTHVLLHNDSKEYARCLVDLTERASLQHMPVSALVPSHIPLTERVKNILSKERNMDIKLKTPTAALIFFTALLCLILIAGGRLSFAESREARSLHITEAGQPKDYGITLQPLDQEEKEVEQPKLIKKVDPVYPEEAAEKGLEDTVVIEGITDKEGNVVKVEALKGEHDILIEAAKEAVRQWKYEPMKIDGKPVPTSFTVTCRFRNDPEKKKAVTVKSAQATADEAPPVHAGGNIKGPKLIKKVDPVYPDEAKKNEIEGVVIIEATTNAEGDVVKTKILRSIPALDEAALEAVRQWKYEPMEIDGKPYGVVFTVTLRFNLK